MSTTLASRGSCRKVGACCVKLIGALGNRRAGCVGLIDNRHFYSLATADHRSGFPPWTKLRVRSRIRAIWCAKAFKARVLDIQRRAIRHFPLCAQLRIHPRIPLKQHAAVSIAGRADYAIDLAILGDEVEIENDPLTAGFHWELLFPRAGRRITVSTECNH